MRFKLALGCLLFAGLCVCLTSVDMLLREGFAAPNARIVFTSAIHDRRWVGVTHAEIFVMDADGGNQERLTNNTASDESSDMVSRPDEDCICFQPGPRVVSNLRNGRPWKTHNQTYRWTAKEGGSGLVS